MVHVGAPPGEVWDLVSDVTRIGEFSPETFEAQWLDSLHRDRHCTRAASSPSRSPARVAAS